MLEEVLKVLRKGGGRVADGFHCLLATGVSDAPFGLEMEEVKAEDGQMSGSDGEAEKQLHFDVPKPCDPEDEEEMRKFKKLKADSTEYLEVLTSDINPVTEELANIKADVDMLTLDNIILEEWNGDLTKRNAEMTSDLKNKSDECDNLRRQLRDKEEENECLRAEKWEMKTERDEANIKAHQIVEKLTEEMHKRWDGQIEKLANENATLKTAQRDLEDVQVEEITMADVEWARAEVLQKTMEEMKNRRRKLEDLLPQQLEFLKRKTIREFVGSGDLIKMVSPLMIHCIIDGFKMGLAECRQMLKRAGKTIQCLKNVEFNPHVDYEPRPTPSPIILDPIVWNTDNPSNPRVYVKKWGQELLQGLFGSVRPDERRAPPPSVILKDKAP
ncbi:hypothetical protein Dimus_019865 [Dionaea muscipula]